LPKDRQDALQVVASRSGRPGHLIEKDFWVVWTLSTLFDAPSADDLVFEDAHAFTSLVAQYPAIQNRVNQV
jgi:hypothetical protein